MVPVGSGKLQSVPEEPLKFEWAELSRGNAVSGASGFFNGLLGAKLDCAQELRAELVLLEYISLPKDSACELLSSPGWQQTVRSWESSVVSFES